MKLTQKRNNQRKNDSVQSVLVTREHDFADLPDMMEMLGFNYNIPDITKKFYRIRQFNPGSFRDDPRYKITKSVLLDGVEYVVEY